MKHLFMLLTCAGLFPCIAQESGGSDSEGSEQVFQIAGVTFTVNSLEAGSSGVTLSITVDNGSGGGVALSRNDLAPLLTNDRGENAFGNLPAATEVSAGSSERFDLAFAGISGNFFTLSFNAPRNLVISGTGEWPVYYVGPILTESVTTGTQSGSQALDLSVSGSLSDTDKTLEVQVESVSLKDGRIILDVSLTREEGDDVTSKTSFAYLGVDCYAPTRISLTDADGTVYVPDYHVGLLEGAPELTVSESVGEPSYSGELQFAPLLESTAGPLTLDLNACNVDNAQAKAWSPPLSVSDISLPSQ